MMGTLVLDGLTSKQIHAQSQHQKHLKKMRNMFKISNRDIGTTSMTSLLTLNMFLAFFQCFYFYFLAFLAIIKLVPDQSKLWSGTNFVIIRKDKSKMLSCDFSNVSKGIVKPDGTLLELWCQSDALFCCNYMGHIFNGIYFSHKLLIY